ncbi:hypothetical protein QR680_005754 [Steinernema hermaphroditum]|uniref:Uncharacterized protein n=1 Tax=Steinernema hermaphroditum TaxID=289476 RepID=A0AA39HVK6_9BILA|nr:hypothetical protein QR680_005754 [Steinernema hermaphroditum]
MASFSVPLGALFTGFFLLSTLLICVCAYCTSVSAFFVRLFCPKPSEEDFVHDYVLVPTLDHHSAHIWANPNAQGSRPPSPCFVSTV